MPSLVDRREHGAPSGAWACRDFTPHRPPHRDGPTWDPVPLHADEHDDAAPRAFLHGASPTSSLSACLYAMSGTAFSSLAYGMPQSVRTSSKSVMKQSSAWPFTVSATSASK